MMKGSGGGGANQVDVVVGMDNPKTNVYVTHCEIQFCLVAVLGGGVPFFTLCRSIPLHGYQAVASCTIGVRKFGDDEG